MAAQIYGNIQHRTMRDPHQFPLRIDRLVVNAPDDILL